MESLLGKTFTVSVADGYADYMVIEDDPAHGTVLVEWVPNEYNYMDSVLMLKCRVSADNIRAIIEREERYSRKVSALTRCGGCDIGGVALHHGYCESCVDAIRIFYQYLEARLMCGICRKPTGGTCDCYFKLLVESNAGAGEAILEDAEREREARAWHNDHMVRR